MDNPKNRTVLSLCTGYGGLERGIEAVIGECFKLAYVEIEAFAVANLVNKMETGKLDPVPIWTDLKTFDARPFRGAVDIITGGYPCQPFSAAGNRKGEDDPRHLWPYIRTIVMDCQPRQCFFENVEGHLTLGISEVLSDLEAMGYRSEVGIFSAVEAGAPHQRKRVFILADSDSGRLSEPGICQKQQRRTETVSTGKNELGDSKSDNERRTSIPTMHREGVKVGGPSGDVSDPINDGSGKSHCNNESKFSYQNGQKWPARPGETQHEWEEPRVIASRIANRHGRLANPENLQRGTVERGPENGILQPDKNKGYPKPQLGRTIDGTRNRVDRLRLLGNGVVWQTAAKAYYTLSEKLNGKT